MSRTKISGTLRAACALVLGLLLIVSGCSRTDSTAGVENLWRAQGFEVTEGVTTEEDLLAELGPPSQIINLGDETVFYYLSEAFRSDRLLLIVYNTATRVTRYDRAIFFFDRSGVLTKASFSQTALPYP